MHEFKPDERLYSLFFRLTASPLAAHALRVLKQIRSDQLRVGMFLHELCGSWMDNPFWRRHVLLNDERALVRVQRSAIRQVIIDTDRGLDIDSGFDTAPQPHELSAAVAEAEAVLPVAPEITIAHHEFHAAAALCRRSMLAAQELLDEVRQGRPLTPGDCRPIVTAVYDAVCVSPVPTISMARLKTADSYTVMHAVAVAALMITLARQMALPLDQVQEAGLAGLLIDCGKARMPSELIDRPSRVDHAELDLLHTHARRGHELLQKAGGFSRGVLGAVLHHHERFDGAGYPDGLVGEAIPLTARMAAICDVYDAVTSRRPYRGPWDPGEAMRHLAQAKGQFDPQIFQHFVKAVGIYPTGALVRMASERLGVVTGPSTGSLVAPKVRLFYSVEERHMIDPFEMDLADPACGDRIVGVESPEAWRFPGLERLWRGAPPGEL